MSVRVCGFAFLGPIPIVVLCGVSIPVSPCRQLLPSSRQDIFALYTIPVDRTPGLGFVG